MEDSTTIRNIALTLHGVLALTASPFCDTVMSNSVGNMVVAFLLKCVCSQENRSLYLEFLLQVSLLMSSFLVPWQECTHELLSLVKLLHSDVNLERCRRDIGPSLAVIPFWGSEP